MTKKSGDALFAINAVVFPGGPFDRGVLMGTAVHLDGPHVGRELPLRGIWVEHEDGKGRFSAVVLRRSVDDGDVADLQPVIRLDGRYRDPNGPVPPPGTFLGRWEPLP